MGISLVVLTCENPACQKEFTKQLAEFNRSEKLGRKHFCSLSCFARSQAIYNLEGNRKTDHLKKGSDRDAFSPFRHSLKIIKKSSKKRNAEYTVTLEELKLLWEQQKGICPYTGWELELLPSTNDYERTPLTPRRASVDRKDCSKGYRLDNIQFVAVIANCAKNVFSEQELIEFCCEVAKLKKMGKKFVRSNKDADDYPCLRMVRRDEYSPFRQHFKLARRRMKTHGRECAISLEYLRKLWEKQGGCCAYAGWELDNPETTNDWNNSNLHPRKASLDRIDSSVGYVPGNVQFVSLIANFAKRDFQEEELLEFCQAVAEYRGRNG
ncbi:MAG TPA: hypothetical protein DCY88_27925 [Cyanobacteria bacterium UBA11372]|nr:hypothetical protein [Cyanobacteria bacterium UBA11372]